MLVKLLVLFPLFLVMLYHTMYASIASLTLHLLAFNQPMKLDHAVRTIVRKLYIESKILLDVLNRMYLIF